MINCVRIGIASAVMLALTACGGESDSTSSSTSSGSGSSNTGGATTTPVAVSASTFANKNFFTLDPKGTSLYHISTLRFGAENGLMQGGQGYLDNSDYVPSYLDTSWEFKDGALILKDFNWQLAVVQQGTDSIELCGSDYPGAKLTSCADNVREVWYTDKTKAKAFVLSKSTGTTPDLTASTMPDEKLRALFTNMEMDFTEQLTRLYARDQGIADVTGLEQFTNLQRMWLKDNSITDVSKLGVLTKLNQLSLDNNAITDISALASLTNLTKLELRDNKITTLPTLPLTKLTYLAIERNEITDISTLSSMSNLEEIWMQQNRISDVSVLPNLSKLTQLYIEDQKVAVGSFEPIERLKNLTHVDIGNFDTAPPTTKFNLATFLAQLTDKNKMVHLHVHNAGIDNNDVSAITGMPNLQVLAISDSPNVTNLTGWNNDWSKLKRLEVGYNGDGDTAVTFDLDTMIANNGLNLSQLTHLKIAQTNATDDNLITIGGNVGSNLINLDVRSISSTGYDFGSNFSVPNLQQFRLAKSGERYEFADIGKVLTPSKLTQLYLEKGTITGLSAGDYSNLTSFRPRQSNISDMTAETFTEALKKMTKLETLDIRETKVGGSAITCSQLVDLGLSASLLCRGD